MQTILDRFSIPSLVRTPRYDGLAAPSPWAGGSGEMPAFDEARGAYDLAAVARAVTSESSLVRAAAVLQSRARILLRVLDSTCVWIDWPRRIAHTLTGRASPQVTELVLEVAGTGKRRTFGNAVIVPIGPAPARAVLALRKPIGIRFRAEDLAMIDALVASIAPTIDTLVVAAR